MSKSQKTNPYQHKEIIDKYLNNINPKLICKEYNINYSYIFFLLKKYDIQYEKANHKVSLETQLLIVEAYKKENSRVPQIAKQFGLSPTTIRTITKKYGAPRKTWNDYYSESFNVKYFDILDSHDKAYILGLLYADGYSSIVERSTIISLKESDKYLLDEIAQRLNSKLEIKRVENQDGIYYRLAFFCKRFAKVLHKLGCVHKKSLILNFPTEEIVSREYIWSFIRGYFDGDGSVFPINQNNMGKIGVEIIGSHSFIFTLKCVLEEYHICSILKKDGNNSVVRIYRQNEIKKFYQFLYSGETDLLLKRKKDRFDFWSINYNFNEKRCL